jgi:hypothetical protein
MALLSISLSGGACVAALSPLVAATGTSPTSLALDLDAFRSDGARLHLSAQLALAPCCHEQYEGAGSLAVGASTLDVALVGWNAGGASPLLATLYVTEPDAAFLRLQGPRWEPGEPTAMKGEMQALLLVAGGTVGP